MTLADRVRVIISALPDTAMVTFVVADLRDWLDDVSEDDLIADLTCEQVAERLGGSRRRTPACIRGWCRSGKLAGAYRMHGTREWRIPLASLRAFLDDQRNCSSARSPKSDTADLGAWRRE